MGTRPTRHAVAACAVIGALVGACTIPPTDVPSPLDGIASWSQVTGSGPPVRWGHVAVFDRARRRMIVWGGTNLSSTHTDLWSLSLDTKTWQSLNAPGGPPGRVTAAAVADGARDRMIIVGGSGSGSVSNEVWALDLGTLAWQQLASGPPARFDAAATTDGAKAWLFGGYSATNHALDDLWELDLASGTWQQLPTPTGRPSPRTNVGFGVIGRQLFLTGGHDEDGLNPDSWTYDLDDQRWTKLDEANPPFARAHYAFATDPTCGLVWLLGGDRNDYVSDSFELLAAIAEPEAAFFPIGPMGPEPRRHAAIVFDPDGRRVVLFGGWQGLPKVLGDTWIAAAPPCASP
jgi:hypothetical protein